MLLSSVGTVRDVLRTNLAVNLSVSSMRSDETRACARILRRSFERASTRALSCSRESEVAVLREDGDPLGLVVVRDRRAGFGGRFVRATCLSSLCIETRARSRGLGSTLLGNVLVAAHARGIGVAVLIPRVEALYLRHGFARGGLRFAAAFELAGGRAANGTERVREFERSDEAAWLELAEGHARDGTSIVVPTPADRARRARAPRRAYVLERGGRVVGSITLSQRLEQGRMTLYVHELLALDALAAQRAWAFVTSLSPAARRVRWRAAPTDPFSRVPQAAHAAFEVRGSWMLRVVDARAALASRGFARGLHAEFELALRDPLIPANEGRFVLSIQDGGASIREGGGGLVQCDIASLASLFASARSATALAAEGQLSADAATLRALDAAFVLGRCSLQSLP